MMCFSQSASVCCTMSSTCYATLSRLFVSHMCTSPSTCVCRAAGSTEAPFAAFGVFDGHGGKFAATHAAKHLLDRVMAVVDRGTPAPMQPPPSEGPSGEAAPEAASPALQGSSSQGSSPAAGPAGGLKAGVAGAGDSAVPKGASARACALWRLQDELLERLPQVGPLATSWFDCIKCLQRSSSKWPSRVHRVWCSPCCGNWRKRT